MDQVNPNTNPVEIWGAAEYTIARINNSIHDQLALSGHEERPGDLELFSDLNIKTIRYPLLWEKYALDEKKFFDLHDERLSRLRELNIKPVAGLLHHGSGPFFTSLEDTDFPRLLSDYALKIAERYPWIDHYTPVNEPLTTARFSGLYGLWYPHKHDDHSFARIFLNELKGVVLAMKAIRSINKDAKLIQTEDICKIHSTNNLKYQADFENTRRWLTFDILTCKLDSDHPLWKFFINLGIDKSELEFFLANSIDPDICGFNYYVTSERYLDHRKAVYPPAFHGGNMLHEYADVEAVRANMPVQIDLSGIIREAWERYKLPIALTEVHLTCTREEQLRWFYEAFQKVSVLKSEGIDIRAITAWSFFGSFDWNTLLTQKNKSYEPGVFDIRSGTPRPTALASYIKSLGTKNSFQSLLQIPGWWRRNNRFIFKAQNEEKLLSETPYDENLVAPLLIIGATGSLGSAIAKVCELRGIKYSLTERKELDIASEESVQKVLQEKKPWGIINAAGFSRIDEAEKSSMKCFRENIKGPGILAEACLQQGIKLVTFSTDQVFDGRKRKPYTETDCTQPLNYYGLSKRMAEEMVLKINPNALIIRSGLFFNPWHTSDYLGKIIHSGLLSDQPHYLASDIIISPAYIPDLVNNVLDLLIDGESGIWHLSNQEEISYSEFATLALKIAGMNSGIVSAVPSGKLKYTAIRPLYSVLKSSHGITLPLLENALQSYLFEFFREPSLQTINQSSSI